MRSSRKFSKPASGHGSDGTRRKICTNLAPEMLELLSKRAEQSGKSISAMIAELVERGLIQEGGDA